MKNPSNLFYTKDHEWISATSKTAEVGVTAFALEQLGDVVHVELPKVGQTFKQGDSFGTIESTKTVSDLYMPVSGKILDVNQEMSKDPSQIELDPYKKGWLIKIEILEETQKGLLSSTEYTAFTENT